MKAIKFLSYALLAALASISISSCSDDDIQETKTIDPNFHVWVSIGGTSGMGSENTQLVQAVESLAEQQNIDFKGTGADVTSKLYQESIIKGGYYYQVPKEKDRFGKYRIENNRVEIVKEFPFKSYTLRDRRYSHAWINNKTLVLLASNGDASKVIWIKVDTEDMKIVSEGELDLPALPAGGKFSTSGLAGYRPSDGKIIYSYTDNNDKVRFYVSFINASDMTVVKTVTEDRAEFMAGTAYGELLQDKTFFDANGNYYIACNSVIKGAPSTTQQYGSLLRIKKDALEMDATYAGYQGDIAERGKIVTVDYLANDKAILYIQDPKHTGASGWGSDYNCYYAILDLKTDKVTELDLPYSEGTFSQRSIVKGEKAYIGVNPKNSSPAVYVYDITTGKLTKGLTISEGYSFDRIVNLKD